MGSEECGSTDDLDDDGHEDDEISNDAQSSPQFLDGRASSNQSHHLLELDAGSGNEDGSLGKCDENSLATKRRGPRTTIKSKQVLTILKGEGAELCFGDENFTELSTFIFYPIRNLCFS